MHCSNCGAEVSEKARFCPRCGSKIDAAKANDPDVTDIVAKLQNGTDDQKSAAFEALYNATYKKTYGHIYSKINNRDTADELVQDVYASVWEHIGSLQEPKAFYRWYWNIVDHKCADWLDKKLNKEENYAKPVSDDEGHELDPLTNVSDDSLPLPEGAIADTQLHELLLGSINELPDNQRYVIKGFYFENKKIQTLVEELGSTESTVKSWLKRGRASMFNSVSQYANANGLKLAPVTIIPLMLLLSKKDAYACEAMAVHGAETYSALRGRLGIKAAAAKASSGQTAADAVKDTAKRAQEAAKKFAESDEWAATKQGAKKAAEEGADAARKAARAAQEKMTEFAASDTAQAAGAAVAGAAKSGLLVKVVAGIAVAAVAVGGINAALNHGKQKNVADEDIIYDYDFEEHYDEDDYGHYSEEFEDADSFSNSEEEESRIGDTVITSLEDISDEAIEALAKQGPEGEKDSSANRIMSDNFLTNMYYSEVSSEYIGSYLMVLKINGETHNVLFPVRKYHVVPQYYDSEGFDFYAYGYMQNVRPSSRGGEIGYVCGFEDDNGNFDSEYANAYYFEGSKYYDIRTGYADDLAVLRYINQYGTIYYRWRHPGGGEIYPPLRFMGFEDPTQLEEVMYQLLVQQDAEEKYLESDIDINSLEVFEYHTDSLHIRSKDVFTHIEDSEEETEEAEETKTQEEKAQEALWEDSH